MSLPTLTDLTEWLRALGEIGLPPGPGEVSPTDAERIDLISAIEKVKGAACAAQGRVAHDFEESQRAAQRAAGVPAAQVGSDVAAQVAMARRESPSSARTFLGLHRVLNTEMPHTARALSEGRITEWTATLLARETACLQADVRGAIDEKVCGSDLVDRLSRNQLLAETRKLAARLDNAGVAERRRLAEEERRVTIRPAPDTMTYLTALVPVVQGVAMHAALKKYAQEAKGAGDPRTVGQLMADRMWELITGRTTDVPPPVDLRLVMTEKTLFQGDDEPAVLPGYDVLPADLARALVKRALGTVGVWITRLYTAPGTGQLMALDSRRRTAPAGLADFVRDRDQRCRTPWCGAPLRHVDHAEPYRDTGRTAVDGLQGLCEACNYVKEMPGWSARPLPGPVQVVEVTTPTGHVYLSYPPALPDDGGPPRGPGPARDDVA